MRAGAYRPVIREDPQNPLGLLRSLIFCVNLGLGRFDCGAAGRLGIVAVFSIDRRLWRGWILLRGGQETRSCCRLLVCQTRARDGQLLCPGRAGRDPTNKNDHLPEDLATSQGSLSPRICDFAGSLFDRSPLVSVQLDSRARHENVWMYLL